MGRSFLTLACLLLAGSLARGQNSPASAGTEWRNYGNDPGGMRFSPLKQINAANVHLLQRAWTYEIPFTPNSGIAAFEATPLMVDDVLYFTTSTSEAIALDAETGKQLWVFDPSPADSGTRNPLASRGAAYWEGDSAVSCAAGGTKLDQRVFFITANAHLFALDPRSGRPAQGFGDGGSIDLRVGVADNWPKGAYSSTSPPAIYKDLLITGSAVQEIPSKGPSGDVRAFDVHTGKLVWRFHTVPGPAKWGTKLGKAIPG